MTRLIDADKLKRDLIIPVTLTKDDADKLMHRIIDEAPTIDAIEVKHGEWKLDPNGMDWNIPAWRCSLCHAVNNNIGVIRNGVNENPLMWTGSNFCPHCGAEMRERSGNENND